VQKSIRHVLFVGNHTYADDRDEISYLRESL
jgi:hypothetical protein